MQIIHYKFTVKTIACNQIHIYIYRHHFQILYKCIEFFPRCNILKYSYIQPVFSMAIECNVGGEKNKQDEFYSYVNFMKIDHRNVKESNIIYYIQNVEYIHVKYILENVN